MLTEFQGDPVTYIETMNVTEGVTCDVYSFNNDNSKDLGIVKVAPHAKTPKQKILQGERTIEGYLGGEALFIKNEKQFIVNSPTEFEVHIGDEMQWQAKQAGLTFYEICYPPYQDGRFENLPE